MRKIPLFRTALATLTAATGVSAAVPVEAQTTAPDPVTSWPQVNPADPLLWSGILKNSAGVPSGGTIRAYLQSNPGKTDAPEIKQVPLASLEVNVNGSFQLRAAYRPEFDALVDRAGNLTVFTVASTTSGEQTLGMASIRWMGRWVDPVKVARSAPAGSAEFMADVPEGVSYDVVTPSNVVNPPGSPAVQLLADDVGPYPADGCRYIDPAMGLAGSGAYHPWLPESPQIVVTQRTANLTGYASVKSTYGQSNTTTSEVAVSSGGEVFFLAGNMVLGKSTGVDESLSVTGSMDGSVNGPQVKKYYIYSSRRVSKFLCGGGVMGPLREYTTVHPYNWEYGFGGAFVNPVVLTHRDDLCDPIVFGGTITRGRTASSDVTASYSVEMKVNGDAIKKGVGKALIGNTWETSVANKQTVSVEWSNKLTNGEKWICGDKGHPTRDRTDWIIVPKRA